MKCGACLSALVHRNLTVAEYTALQMKQAVAGHGRAAKAQVQEMVKRLLRLNRAPGADASNALGVAICAAHHAQIPKAITSALNPKKRSK